MKLTDILSESMTEGKFFGLPKDTNSYVAIPAHKWKLGERDILAAPQVFRVTRNGRHYPHTFTLEDILDLRWELKEHGGILLVTEELYNGIAEVDGESMELLTKLFEIEGYGVVDSVQEIHGGSTFRMFLRSNLFSRVKDGSPTPFYTFEYEEDTRTLKASQI